MGLGTKVEGRAKDNPAAGPGLNKLPVLFPKAPRHAPAQRRMRRTQRTAPWWRLWRAKPTAAQRFHFSIGPVQSFVSEARRTRDLWAGSFLLSWLTGQAMVAVKKELNGKIEFPEVGSDRLYKAVLAAWQKEPGERIAMKLRCDYQPSLTNRFVAYFPQGKVTPGQIETIVVGHVHRQWRNLAQAVWDTFIAPAGLSPAQIQETEKIWNRQIGTENTGAFWDILWVLGPASDSERGDSLERRKTWRVLDAPPEPGDMCRMMGHYQELSGYTGAQDRTKQNEFWEAIRESISKELDEADEPEVELLELRTSARLCAIALVKRLFPRLEPDVLNDVIGWLPRTHDNHADDYQKRTRKDPNRLLISYRPSTAFMAAAYWIARAKLAASQAYELRQVLKKTHNVHPVLARAEQHTNLTCHRSCAEFAWTDGRLFYKSVIQSQKEPGIFEPETVGDALKALSRAELPPEIRHRRIGDGERPSGEPDPLRVGAPSPYYAVLLMDGDKVGKLIRENAQAIARPLARFARIAGRIIEKKHSGCLIYAGGDDLLALLPIEDALTAAEAVQRVYRQLIKKEAPQFVDEGTVSAAVVFAHYEASLSGVLRRAHHLLEKEAKDGNGRASLALAIHRTDGAGPEWVSTWEWSADPENSAGHPASLASDLHCIASRGNSLVSADPREAALSTSGITSNRFVYGTYERLGAFFRKGEHRLPVGKRELIRLLKATGGEDASSIEDMDWDRLWRVLNPQCRKKQAGNMIGNWRDETRLDFNGLLILRFLASEWRRIEKE